MGHRPWTRTLLILAALVLVGAWILGSWPTRLAGTLAALGIARGAWRGASAVVATLLGCLGCALFVRPAARAVEASVAPVLGWSGLEARAQSFALAALAIFLLVVPTARWGWKRWTKDRDAWRGWDRVVGGTLGGVEGVLIACLLLGGVLALEPVARARAASQPGGLARRALGWADDVRGSGWGAPASRLNPLGDSRLLRLVDDFVAVSQHRPALESMLASEVYREIAELPSVRSAIERLRTDPALEPSLREGVRPDARLVRELLRSPAVLAVLDDGALWRDLSPRVEAIERELARARAMVKPPG